MPRIFFMTSHGTLLVRREDGFGHLRLREVGDMAALVSVEGDVTALRQSYAGFLERRALPALTVDAPAPALGTLQLHPHPERGLVHLAQDGRILSAAPEGGGTDWIEGEARDWELMLPLGEQDFGQIVTLFSNDWILKSRRTLVRSWEIELGAGHALKLGECAVPLARNLPLEGARFPYRTTILVDGWRIEELCLYKPLVYYAAYKAPWVHAQLFISIRSLYEFGQYRGQLHAITDLDPEALSRGAGGIPADALSVQNLAPDDFAGFVASKYLILEHGPAWRHQPVCYLDPDIVINAPIAPMLIEMAMADSITAPIEEVGPMRTWPSVGATLLQRDGHDPRFANGFNAGTLGIPNLPGHAHELRLIRRIIENLLAAEGRESLEWVDQEVANYVSFRTAHVDTSRINRFVRYGAPHDSERPGPLTGLVHFWATGKRDRDQIMQRYVDNLRAHARIAHRLSS